MTDTQHPTTHPTTLVPLDQITPSSTNPRSLFEEDELQQLAESIKRVGVLEPILLRKSGTETFFTGADKDAPWVIIAGERRFRAARLAGLTHIPATIRDDLSDSQSLEVQVIENIQRRQLGPVDEARGYHLLKTMCGLKLKQIAERVHRPPDSIAEALKLLDLPETLQDMTARHVITLAQARTLWKYRQFPDFLAQLAEAINRHPTAHHWRPESLADLEELFTWQGPAHFDLTESAILEIHGARYNSPEFEDCTKCPFAARFSAYCLKPSHLIQLRTARDRAQDAEAAARNDEISKQHDGLPTLRSMNSSTYEYLSSKPRGCNDSCPCRTKTVDSAGHITFVCVDPKRFRALRTKQSREDNARRRKQARDDIDLIRRYIDSWTEIPDEALHALAIHALQRAPANQDDHYMRHVKDILGPTEKHRGSIDIAGTRHVSVPTDTLIRTAIEALCVGELEQNAKADAMAASYTSTHYAQWILQFAHALSPTTPDQAAATAKPKRTRTPKPAETAP